MARKQVADVDKSATRRCIQADRHDDNILGHFILGLESTDV
jgi:hypothetical protein